MGPQLYLILALAAAVPVTYGTMWLKKEWAVSVAYKQGKADGESAVSAKGVASANDTVAAIRAAEAETPLPADKAAILALCKKRASCKERGTLR
jgi:hypothetical protein